MEEGKRRRLDAQSWQAVLERFSGSGLGVSEFCKQEGLGIASFYRWRQLLGRGASKAPAQREPGGAFVELGGLASASGAGRLDLRLELGGGLTLHLVRD